MSKKLKMLLGGIGIAAVLLGCNRHSESTSKQNERVESKMKGSYSTIIEGFDWGPAISKVVIKLDEEANQVHAGDYTVKVERKGEELSKGLMGERIITNAYISDEIGNPLKVGNHITLEMKVGPEEVLGSPFNYNIKRNLNQWVQSDYVICKKSAGELWDKKDGEKILIADGFRKDSITYENITLTYAAYEPKSDNKKNPLLIWLHGAGEGGTDPNIVLIGNKVVNLASKEIQDIFDGAYVLAPQSPTMWMDGGNGQYAFDGTSKYTEALMHLIKSYVDKTPDIDKNRIYIGGCSNGGFMTMKMILTYPQYFAAAYPICEAYYDVNISDEQINTIKNVPIWFTHSKNDPVVDPNQTAVKTYKRLLEVGAKDVHFTYWNEVVDTTGLYMYFASEIFSVLQRIFQAPMFTYMLIYG